MRKKSSEYKGRNQSKLSEFVLDGLELRFGDFLQILFVVAAIYSVLFAWIE